MNSWLYFDVFPDRRKCISLKQLHSHGPCMTMIGTKSNYTLGCSNREVLGNRNNRNSSLAQNPQIGDLSLSLVTGRIMYHVATYRPIIFALKVR